MQAIIVGLTGAVLSLGAIMGYAEYEQSLGALPLIQSAQLAASPSNGECLTTNGTVNDWTTCASGGGGGTDGNWSFFNNSGIRLATSTNQVLIGGSATSTLDILQVYGAVRATHFTATSTTASSTFPNLLSTNSTSTNATTTRFAISSLFTFDSEIFDSLTDDATLANNGGDLQVVDVTCTDCISTTETDSTVAIAARNLTVAGTAQQITSSAGAQDLSADRTWTLSLPSHVVFPGSINAGNSTTTNATSTSLAVLNLTAASCDVKASTEGVLSCGTDANSGGGGGAGIGWTWNGVNLLRMSTTTDDLLLGATATTSTAKLEVDGNIFTRDRLIISQAGGLAGGSFYDNTITGPTSYVTVVATSSDTGTRESGIWSQMFLNAVGTANGRKHAILANLEVSTTTGANYGGGLRAVQAAVDHVGTGTIAESIGGLFLSDIKYNGTMTTGVGVKGWLIAENNGTYTTARALEADSTFSSASSIGTLQGLYVDVTSSGAVTNGYGVYIDGVSGTNSWGLFQNGTNKNYFNGNVGIGSTSPFAKLTIHANTGETNKILFQVASSTNSATTSVMAVYANNLVGIGNFTTTTPKLSTPQAGGSAALIVASDMATTSVALSTLGPFAALGNIVSACAGCGISAGNLLTIANYGGGSSGINTFNARGTIASSTATLSGDDLYFMGGRGFGSTGWEAGTKVLINMEATENHTDAANGTSIDFETTPNLSTTRALRMTIDNTGFVGINSSTTPTGLLSVEQATETYSLYIANQGSTTPSLSVLGVNGNGTVAVATSSNATNVGAKFVSQGRVFHGGLTASAGTPNSVCLNATTKEVTENAALTCTVSSIDFKQNVVSLDNFTTEMFMKIKPVQFEYKDRPERARWGFIAERMKDIDPRLADGYDKDGIPRSLDQNAILAVTVKTVQQLEERVRVLEMENKQLKYQCRL